MKKMMMTLAAVLCCVITFGAQIPQTKTKMSPWLQGKYLGHQQTLKQNGGPRRVNGQVVRKYVLALVKSTDQGEAIRQQYGVVMQDFGNGICAAFLPVDKLGELDQNPNILRMEANQPSQLLNDTSAVILGVDKLRSEQTAAPLPQAFTGKGVVAAVMDVGFDFTHPAFRNDDGTSRIKWFWDPMAPDANNETLGITYTSPNEVLAARFCTNADVDSHGTHVMGSMAGRGLNGHYVGMAPESDIMGAYIPLGAFTEDYMERLAEYVKKHLKEYPFLEEQLVEVNVSNVLELIELYRIFEAADAIGQPCVVNWSFGLSPSFTADFTLHDEVFNRLVGPGHIVVIAAGNTGHNKNFLRKNPGEPFDQPVFYSASVPFFDLFMRTEYDEPPFTFGLTFDGIADTLFVNTALIQEVSLKGDTLTYFSPALMAKFMAYPGANDKLVYETEIMLSDGFAKIVLNNKTFSLKGSMVADASAKMELLGLMTAKTSIKFSPEDILNSRGCQQGTLGAPAHMKRAITVGAMHQRTTFTNVLGQPSTFKVIGSEEGHLAAFSSCGPTLDGSIKPDVVAPGHNILSALNSFYRVKNNVDSTKAAVIPQAAYMTKAYGGNYGMWVMSGTSMATPITSGVIALWLQAKPDLTPEDILGVIERTSHQPEPDFSGTEKNVYYGYGEIDAYAGLLDILGIPTTIPTLSRHQPAGITFSLSGRTLFIDGASDGMTVTIYDLQGRPVLKSAVSSGSVQLPGLSSGVYAVQLVGAGSTLIRL